VFPEIVRHPTNCQLITHSENIKKSRKNNDSIIILNDLFERIKKWDIDYYEQEKCLCLIISYQNGERYDKKNYIKNYFEN